MKTYIFSIDGHEDKYYLASDVRGFFKQLMYTEDVRVAIHYINEEKKMRERVFAKDSIRREQKAEEMDHVLKILTRCATNFPSVQKEMFDGSGGIHRAPNTGGNLKAFPDSPGDDPGGIPGNPESGGDGEGAWKIPE